MKKTLSLYRFLILNLLFSIGLLIINFNIIHTLISETALRGPSFASSLAMYQYDSLILETAFIPIILSILIIIYSQKGNMKKILSYLIMYYWLIVMFFFVPLFFYGISYSINEDMGVYSQLGALGYAIIGLVFTVYCLIPFLNALIFYNTERKKLKEITTFQSDIRS